MKNVTNSENFKVAVRVRPLLPKELYKESVVYTYPDDDRKIRIQRDINFHEGYYDKVFNSNSNQKQIFEYVQDQLSDIFEGVNSSILTYGQTGSGKTYTMYGSDWTLNNDNKKIVKISKDKDDFIKHDEFIINPFSEENGIIIRSIMKIFSDIELKKIKFTVTCSFLQLYNEKIYDLLDDSPQKIKEQIDFLSYMSMNVNHNSLNRELDQKNLIIRENKFEGIYLEGLTEYIVDSIYDCVNLLKKGEINRKKRDTSKNEMSSRSHTIFTLTLDDNKINRRGTIKKAKLCLCDLAGSEKYDQENKHKSRHFSEMTSINLSLTALGKVIYSLANKHNHIPYRDSKLTRLLQNSLGGNTRTSFIVNVAPTEDQYEETLSSLKFADRAKSVFVKIKPNEIIANDENMLNKLINEINSLKQILSIRKKTGKIADIETQLFKLKEENERLKQFVKTNENIEKLIEENKLLKVELQKLKSEIKADEFLDEKLSKNKTESTHTSTKKIQDELSENKLTLINAGNNIMRNHNIMSSNNETPEWITCKEMNELKMKNQRLRYLEDLEKKNGMKIIKEIQRIESQKIKKNESKIKKLNDYKIQKQKIDGHLNRINYLYKNNTSVFSEYLAQSLNKNENLDFLNHKDKKIYIQK